MDFVEPGESPIVALMIERLLSRNLNHLVALGVLLEEANVSRAAKRLRLTQSATSHALASLRREFDDELLVRSNRGMRLTEFAEQLRPQLAEALDRLASAVTQRGSFEPRESTRTFSLATADFLLAPLGRQLGHQVTRKMPHGSLRLELARLEGLGERLLGGELDLGLAPQIPLDPAVRSEVVLEEPWVTALSIDHPLVKKLGRRGRLEVEAFTTLEHVVVSPTGRGQSAVDTNLAELGLRRRVRLRFDSFLAAREALVGSRLVLTAPRSLFHELERKVRLFAPPVELPPLRLALHVDRRRAAAPEIRWWAAEVKSALRLLAPSDEE